MEGSTLTQFAAMSASAAGQVILAHTLGADNPPRAPAAINAAVK